MKLDAAARKQIPTTDFALADRRYPIEDQGHAQAALSMVSRYGSPEEQGIVKRKVKEKYGMGESHKDALVKKLQGGDVIINPSAPPVPVEQTITVRELVDKLHDATAKMSVTNPHRALMLHAMSAIMQLYTRLEAVDYPEAYIPDADDEVTQ